MDMINSQNIKSIYSEYFEIIDSFFGAIKNYLGLEEDSHINLGTHIARYPLISDLILDSLGDLDEVIGKFWSENTKKIFDFIKTQNTLKCIYSGDISPLILESFVKKSAQYVDSVIITDPIYNLTIFQKQIILDNKYYLNKLVRHVFNVWKLKDLVLANLKENMIFMLPINIQLVNKKDREDLLDKADVKFTDYINKITGQTLSSPKDSLTFLEDFQKPEELLKKIIEPTLLPIQLRDLNSLSEFIASFRDTGEYTPFKDKSIGWNFGLYIRSQFIRVQEHRFFCEKLIAEPIYDYELPWFFSTMKWVVAESMRL